MWAFNEEPLARAIFDSAIPVISAVGHEVDVTIADLVADARASTPTKAGVTAVPDMHEVLEQLTAMESRLHSQAKSRLKIARQTLRTILAGAVFRNPLLPVLNCRQQLDELQTALTASLKDLVAAARNRLSAAYERIVTIEPHRLLGKKNLDLNNLRSRAGSAIKDVLYSRRMQLAAQSNRLAALNPKSVLHRGYSITTNKKTGLLIKKPDEIQIDDYIVTELAGENLIESKVTKK